jgi:hypothetical protein
MTKLRNLAFAGFLVVNGCAGAVQTVRTGRHEPPEGRTTAPLTESCLRQTARIQECMIEGIARRCGERSEEAMLSCMAEGLSQPSEPAHREISITVAQGEEVFSMRAGGPAVFQIAKLDAGAVDQSGIEFTYSVDRVFASNPTEHTSIDNVQLRMNFDGTRTGDWTIPGTTEIWNFRVQSGEGGRARVSFETDDPRITVRGTTSTAAPVRDQVRPEKRAAPAEQRPQGITSPD